MAIADFLDNKNYSRTNVFEGVLLKLLLNRWAKRMDTNVSDRFIPIFHYKSKKPSWYPIWIQTGKYGLLVEVTETRKRNKK